MSFDKIKRPRRLAFVAAMVVLALAGAVLPAQAQITLTTVFPAGALSGSLTVKTGSTALTSNTKFRVTPTFPSFSPSSAPVGTPVVLTGTGLTQTTRVTFNGVAATPVTVNSDTQVTADVPAAATSGKIAITTKGGTTVSSASFTVTP